MKAKGRRLALFAAMAVLASAFPANAQKHGGMLKIEHMDNPPSASLLEGTAYTARLTTATASMLCHDDERDPLFTSCTSSAAPA